MFTDDTNRMPKYAVILCQDPGFYRLLEIELERFGILAVPDGQGELWLVDLDDASLDLSALPTDTPCICWSRQPLSEHPEISKQEDRVCFLRRPFSLLSLESCIRQMNFSLDGQLSLPIVSQSPDEKSPHLQKEPQASAVVPIAGGGLMISGESIALTPREQALFDCLWSKRGVAVPKAELRAALENTAEDTSVTNTLEVYVCHLRRKIEKPTGRRLITTVRGIGYRLENQ